MKQIKGYVKDNMRSGVFWRVKVMGKGKKDNHT